MLGSLGLKCLHEVADFVLIGLFFERHENARLAEITIIFGNFVLQDQDDSGTCSRSVPQSGGDPDVHPYGCE